MRRKRKSLKLFEIPSGQRVIRIELNDGSMGIYDPEGESHFDGWTTVDDIADGLVQWALLSPDDAMPVAATAVRMWEEWRDG